MAIPRKITAEEISLIKERASKSLEDRWGSEGMHFTSFGLNSDVMGYLSRIFLRFKKLGTVNVNDIGIGSMNINQWPFGVVGLLIRETKFGQDNERDHFVQ